MTDTKTIEAPLIEAIEADQWQAVIVDKLATMEAGEGVPCALRDAARLLVELANDGDNFSGLGNDTVRSYAGVVAGLELCRLALDELELLSKAWLAADVEFALRNVENLRRAGLLEVVEGVEPACILNADEC
jgi:hypothetical protein